MNHTSSDAYGMRMDSLMALMHKLTVTSPGRAVPSPLSAMCTASWPWARTSTAGDGRRFP